jgi:hypothetical protein
MVIGEIVPSQFLLLELVEVEATSASTAEANESGNERVDARFGVCEEVVE